MRGTIEKLASRIAKINKEYGEELYAIAQTITEPKDFLLIDIKEMKSVVNPDEVVGDVEVPDITV